MGLYLFADLGFISLALRGIIGLPFFLLGFSDYLFLPIELPFPLPCVFEELPLLFEIGFPSRVFVKRPLSFLCED